MGRLSRVELLRRQGFDESYNIPFARRWKVKCSQCEALTINGIPCHEHGCPHIVRDDEED